MYCPNCGESLPPAANFCIQCGTKVSDITTPAAVSAGSPETTSDDAGSQSAIKPQREFIPVSPAPVIEEKTVPPALPPREQPKIARPESQSGKFLKTTAGFIFIAVILFAIVGSILKIIAQLGSAMSGQFGPEHIFLAGVIVTAIVWFVKRSRKKVL